MTALRKAENVYLRENLALSHAVLTGVVRKILEHPAHYDWQMQGLGMLRLYLSKDVRLHLWDRSMGYPDASTIHDHPWDADFLIVAGRMHNRRYLVSENGWGVYDYMMQTIQCGPGGCAKGEPKEVSLMPMNPESYGPGEVYSQTADEVHESCPDAGTITIARRYFKADTEHARVFWPVGKEWVSAEPRKATVQEIVAITSRCLGQLELDARRVAEPEPSVIDQLIERGRAEQAHGAAHEH